MNKTETYQLNQWDPEDRILRVDFNADNAAIEAAMKANADAISAEGSARAAADTSIRTDFAAADANIRTDFAAVDTAIRSEFAAADTKIRTDFAAADTTIKNSVSSEATTRANQDAAIRKEFAAADANIAAQNCMVKLADVVTSAAATQIDVNVSSLNLPSYREVIILTELHWSTNAGTQIGLRLNSIADKVYKVGGSSDSYQLLTFYPMYGFDNYLSATKISLCLSRERIYGLCHCFGMKGSMVSGGAMPESKLAPSALTTLNFCQAGTTKTYSLAAGSRITIYGVR